MSTDCTARCTGHCCELITLPISPNGLADYVAAGGKDGETLADMLIYVGYGPVEPGRIKPEATAYYERMGALPVGHQHWYRCRHLQENGNCGNYEHRPGLCRGYPYGRFCFETGCTSCWRAPDGWSWQVRPTTPEGA